MGNVISQIEYSKPSIRDTKLAYTSMVLVTFCIITNNFIRHGNIPWPILFSIPLLLSVINHKIMDKVIHTILSPWVIGVILIPTIRFTLEERYSAIGVVLFGLLTLVSFAIFCHERPSRLIFIGWTIILVLAASAVVFLLQFYEVRFGWDIYNFFWQPVLSQIPRNLIIPAGLVSRQHIFGYQIAGLIPLVFSLLLTSRTFAKRSILVTILLLGCLAVVLSGQRSALGATVVGVGVVFSLLSVRKKISIAIFSFTIAALLLIVSSPGETLIKGIFRSLDDDYIINKLQDYQEIDMRFALQQRAIELIIQNPLGIGGDNEEWTSYAADLFTGAEITAHNAYLVTMIQLGWLSGFVMFLVICLSLLKFLRPLKNPSTIYSSREEFYWRLGLIGAWIALLLNALFHNASLFGIEGVTWTIYVLLWIWHTEEENKKRNQAIGDQGITSDSHLIKAISE